MPTANYLTIYHFLFPHFDSTENKRRWLQSLLMIYLSCSLCCNIKMTVVTSNLKKKKQEMGAQVWMYFGFFSPNLVSRPDFKIIELSNYQIYYQNLARKLQLMHVERKCMNNVLHLHLSCLPFSIPISHSLWETISKTVHWHVLFVVKMGHYLTFHFEMDKDIFLLSRQAPVQRLML